MSRKTIAVRIEEFREMQNYKGIEREPLLETALFLENTFGITLEDEEISTDLIGPESDLPAFVLQKMERS